MPKENYAIVSEKNDDDDDIITEYQIIWGEKQQ